MGQNSTLDLLGGILQLGSAASMREVPFWYDISLERDRWSVGLEEWSWSGVILLKSLILRGLKSSVFEMTYEECMSR